MEILVVGAGAVGRWFADAVDADVAFADVDREAAEAAAEAAVRPGRRARVVDLGAVVSVGTVCIAVPMREAEDAIDRHASKAQQAVIDLTGSMQEPLEAMARVAPARERASFHPLFAPEHAPGRVAMSSGAPGPATDRIRRQLESAGNEVVETSPGEHDEAMRTVQGRAHAAVLAFALAADDVPAELSTPVHDRLLEVVERVAGNDAGVYADIQATFDGAEDVAAAAEALADADRETFEELYGDAG